MAGVSGAHQGPTALRCRTTTDDYQLWAHGFALTATLYHCRDVLAALLDTPDETLERLCQRAQANSGHLAIMLRTLTTLGWVARTASLTKAPPCPLDRLPQRPQTDVLPAQTESGRPLFQRVLVFVPSLSW